MRRLELMNMAPVQPFDPLVAPLVEKLLDQGCDLTDKALQALEHAALDSKEYHYCNLYDDALFRGVIRSQASFLQVLRSLDIDPVDVIEGLRAPPLDTPEYRRTFAATRSSKRRSRLLRRPVRDGVVKRHRSDGARILDGLGGLITCEDLLLHSLRQPVVWSTFKRLGVSLNTLRREVGRCGAFIGDIEQQELSLTYSGGRLIVDAFSPESGVLLDGIKADDSRALSACLSFCSTPGKSLQRQIAEFEWLINKPNVGEFEIQKFFEQRPHFLLGVEYSRLHSQLCLTRADRTDLRPDFFLERLDSNFCDILELKLPSAALVVGKPNRRTFSASLASAIGQLREYSNYFDDSKNRATFESEFGLRAYKPRLQVVIGRRDGFRDYYERSALQGDFPHLQLITFDDVLERMRRYAAIQEMLAVS